MGRFPRYTRHTDRDRHLHFHESAVAFKKGFRRSRHESLCGDMSKHFSVLIVIHASPPLRQPRHVLHMDLHILGRKMFHRGGGMYLHVNTFLF